MKYEIIIQPGINCHLTTKEEEMEKGRSRGVSKGRKREEEKGNRLKHPILRKEEDKGSEG